MKEHDRIILSDSKGYSTPNLALFAFLNLGLIQSLNSGILSPSDAIQRFYHADNCLHVRKYFQNRDANAIMSHGVQLSDLFDSLSPEEAQREFFHELEKIRSLCLKILENEKSSNAVI